MATTARKQRLEPCYKQHTAVDDARGVVLDVAVTTGEVNDTIEAQVDEVHRISGRDIETVTADAGYAKVYAGLERRNIDPVAKKEPIKTRVPLRCFRYDARHDILKCPRGKILRPQRRVKHGRFFYSKAEDCKRCSLRGDCLSKGRVNKAVGDDYPALLRARRRRARWSEEDRRLYQRHRWRSEGFHGEAKTWHGLSRAVRRGLDNMKILPDGGGDQPQAACSRTSLAILSAIWAARTVACGLLPTRYACPEWAGDHRGDGIRREPRAKTGFFNSPTRQRCGAKDAGQP